MSPEPIRFPSLCVDDEALELYILRRLAPRDEHEVDLHLLECDDCQLRLQAEEKKLSMLRQALRETKAESTSALMLLDSDDFRGALQH